MPTVSIPANTWTQLTTADATKATWYVKKGPVEIVATVGAVAPTDFAEAITYQQGQGEAGMPLADYAPDKAATRMYGYSSGAAAAVHFSHD